MNNYKDFLKDLHLKGVFWSFDPNTLDSLPVGTVIEHTLIYADVPEIKRLFEIFDYDLIKTNWEETILPDPRFKKLNYYLARFFFNYKDPRQVLKNLPYETRLERLQHIVAQNS